MGLIIPAINDLDSAGSIEVSEEIFGYQYNETLIHQIVVKYLAGARAGTKAQKTRSDVSGGGIKPWRQKGTGRARSGTSRSPIWRTGGVTFAARPRSYDQKINRKMYRVGLKSIFSELIRQDRLVISGDILPETRKTKDLWKKISALNAKKILIIVDKIDDNLALSSRNIPNLEVLEAVNLNPVYLVASDKVIVTPEAFRIIEGHLS